MRGPRRDAPCSRFVVWRGDLAILSRMKATVADDGTPVGSHRETPDLPPIAKGQKLYLGLLPGYACWLRICRRLRNQRSPAAGPDLASHFASPDTRLIDVAMITAPSGNESHACCSAVRRISLDPMSVSETWKVMPIVNAR